MRREEKYSKIIKRMPVLFFRMQRKCKTDKGFSMNNREAFSFAKFNDQVLQPVYFHVSRYLTVVYHALPICYAIRFWAGYFFITLLVINLKNTKNIKRVSAGLEFCSGKAFI